jgi:tetratricopeptide (TPR) repeat protein
MNSRISVVASLAAVENRLGDWDAAERYARQQIELVESVYGTNAWPLGDGYLELGIALAGKKDYKAAAAAVDRALVLELDVPIRRLASEATVAELYFKGHQLAIALQHMEASVALATKVAGPTSTLTNAKEIELAWMLLGAHQPERARQIAERVLPELEAAKMPPGAVGEARFTLARALPARDRARALELARTARAELERAGPGFKIQIESLDRWLADPDAPLAP